MTDSICDEPMDANAWQVAMRSPIQSPMRPYCKHIDACKAKTPGKHCPPCGLSAKWNDPDFRQKRRTAFRNKMATDPEFKAAHVSASDERLRRWRANPASRVGLHERSLANLAKANTPEAIAERNDLIRQQRLGWCPRHRLDEYRRLARKMSAPEARRLILESEAAEARRVIADFDRRQRERAARDKAQAY